MEDILWILKYGFKRVLKMGFGLKIYALKF